MWRFVLILSILTLVGTSCGGSSSGNKVASTSTIASSAQETTTAPGTDQTVTLSTGTPPPSTTTTVSVRRQAPATTAAQAASTPTTVATTQTTTRAVATTTPGLVATAAITIQSSMFSPTPLNVKVGTRVTATNRQVGIPHTWSSDTGVWESGTLQPNQSFSVAFTKAGRYAYHCNIHTFMNGEVDVA